MPEQDGTTSPPYPSQVTTSPGLYRYLELLRAWVVEQQQELVPLVPRKHRHKIDDEPGSFPPLSVWENVSVVDKYWVLMYIRKIREGWDYTLREHEDSWDSKLALRKRFSLLFSAMHILKEAFVAPEVREMRNQQAADQHNAQMQTLEKHLREVLVPPEMRQDAAKAEGSDEGDLTDWFTADDTEDES